MVSIKNIKNKDMERDVLCMQPKASVDVNCPPSARLTTGDASGRPKESPTEMYSNKVKKPT